MQLTDKQKLVLTFIASFCRKHKYPPTTREIKEHFGWKSQTSAVKNLNALRKKGRISWISGSGRTLTIIEP